MRELEACSERSERPPCCQRLIVCKCFSNTHSTPLGYKSSNRVIPIFHVSSFILQQQTFYCNGSSALPCDCNQLLRLCLTPLSSALPTDLSCTAVSPVLCFRPHLSSAVRCRPCETPTMRGPMACRCPDRPTLNIVTS